MHSLCLLNLCAVVVIVAFLNAHVSVVGQESHHAFHFRLHELAEPLDFVHIGFLQIVAVAALWCVAENDLKGGSMAY